MEAESLGAKLLKTAVIKSLPIMAGYIVLGMGFGILLKVNGYGVLWAFFMSVFIYAGSLQYVGVSLIADGASLISTVLTSLLVNARHLFYGISMIQKYKGAGLKKLYLMFALTDETYSLVCAGDCPENADPHTYYFLISLCNHIYWITGSVLGSLVGEVLPFSTEGIEFVMTALFVTVFVEQWMTVREHRPALIGVGATAVCLFLFGNEYFLIPAMVMITLLLTAFRGALEKGGTIDG